MRAGDVLVSATVYARLRDAVVQTLTAHHKSQPLSGGLPREELREQLFARSHPSVFDRTLDDLAKTVPPIVVLTDRVALATYRMELTPEEERVRERLERAYRDGGLKPSDAAAIASQVGAPAPVIDRMVKLLLRQKTLVKVDALLFHDEALKQLGRRARVEGLVDHPMRLPLQGKLLMTEIGQEIAAAALEVEGMRSTLYVNDENAPDEGRWPLAYMNSYGMTIAAGTSEIQRNILGERVLGMAKSK